MACVRHLFVYQLKNILEISEKKTLTQDKEFGFCPWDKGKSPSTPATQGHTQICTHIHTPLNYNDLIMSLNLLYWIFSRHIILQHNTSIFQYGSLAYKQGVKSQDLQTNMSLYFVSFLPLPPTHHLPTLSLLYLVPFLPPINHNFYFLLLVYFNVYVWLLVAICVPWLCLVPTEATREHWIAWNQSVVSHLIHPGAGK